MMKKITTGMFALALLLAAFPGAAQDFAGSWTANIESNGASYRYVLTLKEGGSCTVRVTGPTGTQAADGFWSWGGSIFKLEARFANPVLPALRGVLWASVASFGGDGNSFTIMVPPDSYRQEKARVTFYKGSGASPGSALSGDAAARSFGTLSKDISAGARVAVVGIASSDGEEGAFLTDELTLAFVNARRFTVMERKDIDAVLREQNFQLSGAVDDDAAVSIGKFLGATVVVSGSVSGEGARRRLVLKAIDVLTAEILAMSQEAL
jgi:TolB-like protein